MLEFSQNFPVTELHLGISLKNWSLNVIFVTLCSGRSWRFPLETMWTVLITNPDSVEHKIDYPQIDFIIPSSAQTLILDVLFFLFKDCHSMSARRLSNFVLQLWFQLHLMIHHQPLIHQSISLIKSEAGCNSCNTSSYGLSINTNWFTALNYTKDVHIALNTHFNSMHKFPSLHHQYQFTQSLTITRTQSFGQFGCDHWWSFSSTIQCSPILVNSMPNHF